MYATAESDTDKFNCDAADACADEPGASSVWCDPDVDMEKRVAALIANLTVSEKAGLFLNEADSVPRLNIKKYNWWSEALHGLARDGGSGHPRHQSPTRGIDNTHPTPPHPIPQPTDHPNNQPPPPILPTPAPGVATSFPQIIGVSSSFNMSLVQLLGGVSGTEARGKNNGLDGELYHGLVSVVWCGGVGRFRSAAAFARTRACISPTAPCMLAHVQYKPHIPSQTLWSPNINIFRDPRWGRGQETPGEDPTLNGQYGTAYIQGLQGDEEANGFLMTSGCIKHYAAYSQETDRNTFAAVVTDQDMQDTYLPAFKTSIVDGKASSVMCSYNAETWGEGVYGPNTWGEDQHGAIPSCANGGILNDLIRDQVQLITSQPSTSTHDPSP